jgi:uncharacterized protein (DUF433 family)
MGLDYAEAARQLDVPLNTFKSHLLRGTKLLREALAGRLEPEPETAAPMIQVQPVAVGGNGRKPGDLRVGPEQSLRRWRHTLRSKKTPAITRDPEIHSGAPVFSGTRIAIKILFDYLEDGQTVGDFVSHYPSVSRDQAVAALEEVEELLEVTA